MKNNMAKDWAKLNICTSH